MVRRLSLYIISLSALALTACNGTAVSSSSTTSAMASIAEQSYCPGPIAYPSSSTIITAIAQYSRFDDSAAGLTSTSTHPIRYAEVQIFNSAGALVQCGETDGQGQVQLAIAPIAGPYKMQVNSRGNNNFVKASVLNSPVTNQFYSISTSFTIDSSGTGVTAVLPIASHNGTLEGGAFSLLDLIVKSNEFLRANTACAFCTTVTVAPKVSLFWQPGFSPASYYGEPNSPMSFFNKTATTALPVGLYVLGGLHGSVCTDTDHFDDSVVVHEYGHFLEYAFGKSDSPGGAHDGDSMLDPRLAWSEGWADYWQAQVNGRSFYRDTVSNSECGTAALAFPDFELSQQQTGQDIPTHTGEGVFRELTTARTLYAANSSYNFAVIWNSFADAQNGFANTTLHFRNPGLFFQQLFNNVTARLQQTWQLDSVFSREDEVTNENYYGRALHLQTQACALQFTAATIGLPGDPEKLLLNHQYFQYSFDGTSANGKISLIYQGASGTPYDLDLYAYPENYVLEQNGSAIAISNGNYPEPGGSATFPGYERVDISSSGARVLLLDVTAFGRQAESDTNFYLRTDQGEYLCP